MRLRSMFDRVLSLGSLDMGIDLGTANTLVYVAGRGIVLNEPSVVAIRKGSRPPVLATPNAVGKEAKAMLERTPGSIVAIRPMKDGVIADFDVTEQMLRYFIRKVHNRTWGNHPRLIIAIPSGITAVEERAVLNSAERAGARKVRLIPEPLAAALGAGLPVADPVASMVVDIGGGTTEVAVISLGELVTQSSIRVAGDKMDDAIIQHVRSRYNLDIGHRTSEDVKIELGSAYPMDEELSREIRGRDLIAGLPRSAVITSEEVREALRDNVQEIITSIKSTLEKTPPELASDLIDRGITLCGGGSMLRGMDRAIAEETGLPTRWAEDPLSCVARGTGRMLEATVEQQMGIQMFNEEDIEE